MPLVASIRVMLLVIGIANPIGYSEYRRTRSDDRAHHSFAPLRDGCSHTHLVETFMCTCLLVYLLLACLIYLFIHACNDAHLLPRLQISFFCQQRAYLVQLVAQHCGLLELQGFGRCAHTVV